MRTLYLNFNNSTTITSDNTSKFAVKTYYYSGSSLNRLDSSNALNVYSASPTGANSGVSGYQLTYGGLSNDNYITWQMGLYDTLSGTTTATGLTYTNLNGGNYQLDIDKGAGLVEIDASGMCNTTAFGEVTSTAPAQVAIVYGDTIYSQYLSSGFTGSNINYTAYTHQDLTQVSSIDQGGFNYPPAIVLRATNSNYTGAATGHTVTATLLYTGVTYVSGGTGTTTTYTGTLPPITFNRTITPLDKYNGVFGSGGPTNIANSNWYYIYDYLPAETNIGIHRGLWTFRLQISVGGDSSFTADGSKSVAAFFINNA